MSILVKCNCGRRFPFNREKHAKDNYIYCPTCHKCIENRAFSPVWKPKLSWILGKRYRSREEEEVKLLLQEFRIKFSMNSWRNGDRPVVSIRDIAYVKGNRNLEENLNRLKRLGVVIRELKEEDGEHKKQRSPFP